MGRLSAPGSEWRLRIECRTSQVRCSGVKQWSLFSRESECVGKERRTSLSGPMLQVHLLRAACKGLSTPVIGTVWSSCAFLADIDGEVPCRRRRHDLRTANGYSVECGQKYLLSSSTERIWISTFAMPKLIPPASRVTCLSLYLRRALSMRMGKATLTEPTSLFSESPSKKLP